MAATIAEATGYDKLRTKETHRLGSERAETRAATWHTEIESSMRKNGTGSAELRRDSEQLAQIIISTAEDQDVVFVTVRCGPLTIELTRDSLVDTFALKDTTPGSEQRVTTRARS